MPSEIAIPQTPLSAQSGNSRAGGPWQDRIKKEIRKNAQSRTLIEGTVAVSITWVCERFRPGGKQPDVDNIAKPIVDALKGELYADDAHVVDVLSRRRTPAEIMATTGLSLLMVECATRSGDSTYVIVDKAPISEAHLRWKI